MKSWLRKHKRSEKCRDRLSELPDEVIVHILSFLPTLDAVRTLLLRRFGNLWTLVPTLEFCETQFHPESDKERNNSTALHSCFSRLVRNVLILHKGLTIDKFLFDIKKNIQWYDDDADTTVDEVEMWIRFALSRDVKSLNLIRFASNQYFPLPVCIYTSQSLVMLELRDCRITVPSRVHMGSLRTLDIANIAVDKNFNDFVLGCPSLKELVIDHAEDILLLSSPSIEKLEFKDDVPEEPCTIDCPNLKILDIRVILNFVEVVNVPTVREVSVFCPSNQDAHKFKRLLEGFQSAEFLTFRWKVDEDLTYCSMVNVGFPENRWKHVVLYSSMQDTCIAGIYSLVRNSPCLEELIIHTTRSTCSLRVEDETLRMLASQEVSSPCVVLGLKVVSMHGYGKPYEGQLQLVEFLLKSAVNLEKLIIFTNQVSKLTSAEELRFVKRLSKFPRASAKAMIVFE